MLTLPLLAGFSHFYATDFAGGAYSAPPDSLAGGEGARCPLPKNLTPFGPHFLALRWIPLFHFEMLASLILLAALSETHLESGVWNQ